MEAQPTMLSASPDPDEDALPMPTRARPSLRRTIFLILKIAVSAGGLMLVYGQLLGRDGVDELAGHIARMRWPWFAAAAVMQVVGIAFSITRWRLLLAGQGIHASARFAIPSFMIGRFWGAFTPGGLGLDGWKLYDVARQTKKPARAVAVTAVEKILGQLAFGIVVMGASVWGASKIGVAGVLTINAFFAVIITLGMTFLLRPAVFQPVFKLVPAQLRPRLQTLLDAVAGYRGKLRLLALAVLSGTGVHICHNLVYVCAAQAIGLPVTPTVVFFTSSIVIMSTLVPLSLNGVGLREATAASVLGAFGVSTTIAAATFTLGWIAEMLVSSIGILFFLGRKAGYDAKLTIEDADRESRVYAELAAVPEARWPSRARGLSIGLGAGLLAGMIVGGVEGVVIVLDGGGRVGHGVIAYGAAAYALFCGLVAALAGLAFAWTGRWMKREAVPEPQAYAQMLGAIVTALAFALGLFRIRRDVFHEELVLKSKDGILLVLACAAAAAVIYAALAFGLRALARTRVGDRLLLRAWGSPALVVALIAGAAGFAALTGGTAGASPSIAQRAQAPASAPRVLLIVVDTLRADHLPAYGYSSGSTPSLDRFAQDAVRFDQAFANASWTRPSFASILTGRHASSHGVMAKSDALSDELPTLAETMRDAGYSTAGFVTNFNVGPYFNFQQGFDRYEFLEPDFVLGADDAAAKLLLVQFLRQRIEQARAARGRVEPGTAYQDAETVNRHVTTWLDGAPTDRPWLLFVGYMDPHDPYFPHPYDGTGYARAAHPSPSLDEAPRLTALYDGEITYWDAQFGLLMDDLRRRGLYDDTLIVVTADHGEELGDHGGFWHGTTLYDEQVHVPLFVKLPGNERAGTHLGHWVQSIDIMPTVLGRAGVAVPAGVQGGSLDTGTTRVLAEESHEGNVLSSLRELANFEERKLIVANPGNPRGLSPVELYRVADDPGERENVAQTERDQVAALTSALDEARGHAARGAVRGSRVEMNEESRRQLCQIGYIDAASCCRDGLLSGDACRAQ